MTTPLLPKASIKWLSSFSLKRRLILLSLSVWLLYLCTFSVRPGQTALVFSVGELIETTSVTGLHFKLPSPLQTTSLIERRVQTLLLGVPDSLKIQTADQQPLEIDSLIKWRIFNPQAFYLRFHGSNADAENFINHIVYDAMNPVLTKRSLKAIAADDRDAISFEIRSRVYSTLIDLGIEVMDVQLKRLSIPANAIDTVLVRMKSDLQNAANQQRTQGVTHSEEIRAKADLEREKTIANAYQQAQTIKGEGDASASDIYAESFGKNPEFYAFQRSLDAYRASFKTKQDLLVLDTSSDFFKYLRHPNAK
jgi:modulator of FtsH protease HflC